MRIHFAEAPDITVRICGICPITYQMSAVHAMEDAFGVTVGGPLHVLRRLIYCGEWIESHALHIYLLIAVCEYDDHFAEEHLPHSNALHSTIKNRGAYFVGPLARYERPPARSVSNLPARILSRASSCAAWKFFMRATRHSA